jgi:hypothetical protein
MPHLNHHDSDAWLFSNKDSRGRKPTFPLELVAQVGSAIGTEKNLITGLKVQAKTESQYLCHVRQLAEYMFHRSHLNLTFEVFCEYVTAQLALRNPDPDTDGRRSFNAHPYRIAILHFMVAHKWHHPGEGAPLWPRSYECKCLCDAAIYNGGAVTKQELRGTLDDAMFQAFDATLITPAELLPPALHTINIKIPLVNYQMVAWLTTGAALRFAEMKALMVKHWITTKPYLLIPHDKRYNAQTSVSQLREQCYHKRIVCPMAYFALEDFCRDRDPDEWLVPLTGSKRAPLSRWNEIIKLCAAQLGWAERFPGLKFDGNHIFRHCGVVKIHRCLVQKQQMQWFEAALQMSPENFRHYARSNAVRMLELEQCRSVAKRKGRSLKRGHDAFEEVAILAKRLTSEFRIREGLPPVS